jgi:hypothetical protein
MGLAKYTLLSVGAALTIGAIAARPARVLAAPPPVTKMARPLDNLRDVVLDGHRLLRAQVGLPALAWSDDLAAAARDHAAELVRTGQLHHAVEQQGEPQGENLWAGTHGAYAYREMLAAWGRESGNFVNAPTPRFSRTGQWQDVGHYAQIVWRGTREVGCAVASDARDDYLVCRYRPAGNVIGEPAF